MKTRFQGLLPAILLFSILSFHNLQAQDQGQLSGNLEANTNFYHPDTTIQGQNPPPYYNHEKSSAEAWLSLNYQINDYTFMVRYDLYNNSPLLNPAETYTHQGIGFLSASKKFDRMTITAGSFYDQFGSGIVFRAYEERAIGLDYAMNGIRIKYKLTDSTTLKAFTGLQKNRFDLHPQVVKGANLEQIWNLGPLNFISGAAIVNRTLDQATMNLLAAEINSMRLEERFIPKYNVFAGSVYNTLSFKDLSLYVEYARKTKEAVFVQQADLSQKLENRDGDVLYSNLNYGIRGLGISLQYKKINSFILNTSPYSNILLREGTLSFLPPISKQHTLRLPARYSISAQPTGEEGVSGELTYSFKQKTTSRSADSVVTTHRLDHSFTLNSSYVRNPAGQTLFREYYFDYTLKVDRRFHSLVGIQRLEYNQKVYELKPVQKPVITLAPFWEFSYRFDQPGKTKKHTLKPSIRAEIQYLITKQDYGDFAFGLLEYSLAPTWSFSVSDMYNIHPTEGHNKAHYYSAFAFYTYHQTRFSFGYAKQVAGVVCTGGVCRLEPAFSGFRLGLTTSF